MAGMFYSLQEAAKKLGKSEDEVRKLAAANKLRLFRDGSNLLFKIDEVNALAAERLDEDLDLELEPAEPGADIFTSLDAPEAKEPTEEDLLLDLGEEAPAAEPVEEPTGEEPTAEIDMEALDLEAEPAAEPKMKEAEADASAELGLAPEEDQLAAAVPDEDLLAGLTEDETAAPAAELPKEAAEEDEISLTSESSALAGSDITDMDTALTGQGINVLADSSAGESTSGDSSAETVAPAGESTEASLEEIEEDVNLDSFGSGSGLLDLSLQADDTSLGGILDEIYTSEGGGEEGKAAAPHGSVEDISAEADHVTADTTEMVTAPEAMMPMTAVAATAFMEVPPDRASNILGLLLFIPLVALLYAVIVAWAAMKNAQLSIVEPIEQYIWYFVGAGVLITGIFALLAFTSNREGKPKAPKAAKAVKEKPAKKDKASKKAAAEDAAPSKSEGKAKKSFLSFSLGKKKK